VKRIGILGGSSEHSTADYYRRLNAAINMRLGGLNTAELLISSMNFALSADCVHENRWRELGAYLAERAKALQRAGADLLICSSNTLHLVADQFCEGLQMPFLHIADPTATAMVSAGVRRAALLGTLPVMSTESFPRRYEARGVEIMVPRPDEQAVIHRIIYDELCLGCIRDESRLRYLEIVDALVSRGATGVVLGCTEIPLLLRQSDRPNVLMFDTTGLHVDAAADAALNPSAE
jgi:aspartate racemase